MARFSRSNHHATRLMHRIATRSTLRPATKAN